jgi:hypothetical protein
MRKPRRGAISILVVWMKISACVDPGSGSPNALTAGDVCSASGPTARLEDGSYQVTLHSGLDVAAYTVADRSGKVVATCVSENDLREGHPKVYRAIEPLLRTAGSANYGFIE